MKYRNLVKFNTVLVSFFAVIAGLYFGASFLIPLTFAAFLAALVRPLSDVLERTGMSRIISSLISTLVVFLVVGGLFFLLFYQLRLFAQDLPQIKSELESFLESFQQQITSMTGLTPEEQLQLWRERSASILETLENSLTNLLGNVLNASLKFLLVLVYLFLLLLYRQKFVDVAMMYVPEEKKENTQQILYKTSRVVHHYLWGRIKVMSILGAIYLVTFLLFDIRYTVLLTIFGALVTIIPYIGPFVSGILPVLFVIVFGRSFSDVLFFAAVILVIQLIESYVLEPVIIGSEVQLSPLAVIIAIIIGGMIWGIAGMILFVPLFSILKILSDHSPNLKPIGYLISDSKKTTD